MANEEALKMVLKIIYPQVMTLAYVKSFYSLLLSFIGLKEVQKGYKKFSNTQVDKVVYINVKETWILDVKVKSLGV